jgi:arylsulfatase A-like enzyme
LVSLESTAAQYLRLYGGKDDVTPHLDLLARQAIVFEKAYAVYPESIKGLFSILCSTFPAFDTTAVMYEGTPCRSIAAVLAQAGYRTALFHSGRFAYLGMRSIVSGRGYQLLEDAGDIGGHHESSFGVDETSTVARMLSWIDSRPAGEPFFLTYLPIAGHHPYETPDGGPFEGADERGRYRNALHYADQSLGSLVAGVRARGLEQRTIWIVLGDHGEAFGQHVGNYGHTFFLYDENVRVPFLVAAPGLVDRQQRSRTTVSLVDTGPTILDLLGVPRPPEYQGHSALDGRSRMALFFTDYSLPLVGLRDGRWKFVHDLASGRSKLFDLDHDAGERTDLSSLHPSRVAAYQRALRAWSAGQKSYVKRETMN